MKICVFFAQEEGGLTFQEQLKADQEKLKATLEKLEADKKNFEGEKAAIKAEQAMIGADKELLEEGEGAAAALKVKVESLQAQLAEERYAAATCAVGVHARAHMHTRINMHTRRQKLDEEKKHLAQELKKFQVGGPLH